MLHVLSLCPLFHRIFSVPFLSFAFFLNFTVFSIPFSSFLLSSLMLLQSFVLLFFSFLSYYLTLAVFSIPRSSFFLSTSMLLSPPSLRSPFFALIIYLFFITNNTLKLFLTYHPSPIILSLHSPSFLDVPP